MEIGSVLGLNTFAKSNGQLAARSTAAASAAVPCGEIDEKR